MLTIRRLKVMHMAKRKAAKPRQARRARSESAILDAFEQLFQRQGAHGVGVNAVLDTAGVGKRLLYEYFGDLEGLAVAWASEHVDPLGLGERHEDLATRLRDLPVEQRTPALLADYATALREHPWALQVLLAEFQAANSVTRAMGEIRRRIGEGYESLLVETEATTGREGMALAYVLHAAANYLALRARFAPDYNGLDLQRDADWVASLGMLRQVAGLAASRERDGKPAKRTARRTREP